MWMLMVTGSVIIWEKKRSTKSYAQEWKMWEKRRIGMEEGTADSFWRVLKSIGTEESGNPFRKYQEKGELYVMRSEAEVRRVIDLYADTVKRLCMIYLKNEADTEDIFQTVFLKYFESKTKFENEAHEKAWIIRVTINCCKIFT